MAQADSDESVWIERLANALVGVLAVPTSVLLEVRAFTERAVFQVHEVGADPGLRRYLVANR